MNTWKINFKIWGKKSPDKKRFLLVASEKLVSVIGSMLETAIFRKAGQTATEHYFSMGIQVHTHPKLNFPKSNFPKPQSTQSPV